MGCVRPISYTHSPHIQHRRLTVDLNLLRLASCTQSFIVGILHSSIRKGLSLSPLQGNLHYPNVFGADASNSLGRSPGNLSPKVESSLCEWDYHLPKALLFRHVKPTLHLITNAPQSRDLSDSRTKNASGIIPSALCNSSVARSVYLCAFVKMC
jgi:hypothetical protein